MARHVERFKGRANLVDAAGGGVLGDLQHLRRAVLVETLSQVDRRYGWPARTFSANTVVAYGRNPHCRHGGRAYPGDDARRSVTLLNQQVGPGACWDLRTSLEEGSKPPFVNLWNRKSACRRAFIYEAIRTPRGKQKNGSLHESSHWSSA